VADQRVEITDYDPRWPDRFASERRRVADLLADAGWLLWPDDPCRDYRLWFLRPSPEARTHHLQVIGHGDQHALALVAFRDALPE
jgi:GrpB-like predicted nucleotidyltransferase (UPF0157 family)